MEKKENELTSLINPLIKELIKQIILTLGTKNHQGV